MKKLLGKIREFFEIKTVIVATMLVFLSTSTFAQSVMLPEKIDQYTPWLGLLVVVWEYLLANNKNVKSNSTIDLLISGAKKFFGLDRYTKK